MAVNLPLVGPKAVDPYVANLDANPTAVDPNQDLSLQLTNNQSSTPDTSVPGAVVSPQEVPLSGDNYAPPAAQPADTSVLPFVPQDTAASSPGLGWANDSNGPSSDTPPGLASWAMGYGDSSNTQLPQAQKLPPSGPPPTTYGNDIAGSILSAEAKLPGGQNTQALIHGAQSQALPFGGFLAGMEAGGLIGSLAGPVGTVIGGLIGGFIGNWVGEQVQNEVGKDVVPKETMDALNTQVQYEQQNSTFAYGVGQAIPQILAFKPNPSAIKGAFQLMGKVTVAPSIAERIALIKSADSEVKNQLLMLAMGSATSAYNAQQEISQGNFNPALFMINLASSTLLSQPRSLLQGISPMYRKAMSEQMKAATGWLQDGANHQFQDMATRAGDDPRAQELAGGLSKQLDTIHQLVAKGSGQEAIAAIQQFQRDHQELSRIAGLSQAQAATPEAPPPVAPEVAAPAAQLDPIAQELIDRVNAGEITPEEADRTATQQNIPNWESLVAKRDARQQAINAGGAQQIKDLAQNPAFPRQPDVSPQDHLNAIQAAAGRKGLGAEGPPTAPTSAQNLTATPEQIKEAVVKAQEAEPRLRQQLAEPIRVGDTVTYNGEQMEVIGHIDFYNALLRDAKGDEYEVNLDEIGSPEQVEATKRAAPPGEYSRTVQKQQRRQAKEMPFGLAEKFPAPEAPPREDAGGIDVSNIKRLISETRVERGGETRAIAELDPSLIPTLGKNMYSGDIGKIAVKEGIQNAIDSMRGVTDNGGSRMSIILRNDGVSLKDNGRGMTPEVATKELVDIGGSFGKDASGASGGWGLAKVALFSNAKEIDIHTVAKLDGGGTVETHLSGSGVDWADKNKGLRVETVEHPWGDIHADQYTGTTINLTFNDGVRYNAWNASKHVSDTIDYMNTREPVGISLSGVGSSRDTNPLPVRDRYDHMTTLDGRGAKVDIYANPSYAKQEYSIPVRVLNNGIYQFDMHVTLPEAGSLEMPGDIVMDVHAKGSPREEDYPWETNRESVRPALREQMEKYITSTLIHDAAKKQADTIKKAISDAPKINNGRFRVVDTFGKTPADSIQAVQNSEAIDAYMRVASRSFTAFKGGISNQGPELYGVSLSADHLGVSIHSSAGGPGRLRNYVLLNPFMIFEEVGRGSEAFEAPIPLDEYPIQYWNAREGRYELPSGEIIIPDDVKWDSAGNKIPLSYDDADFAPNGEFIGTPHSAQGRYDSRALPEVSQETSDKVWAQRAKQFAARTISTLIHEYAHEDARGHDEHFAGVLTREIDKNMDDAYKGANTLTRHLSKNNYEGIKEIAELYRTYFSGRMGRNEVFRNISTGLAATTPQRGIPEGYPEEGASSGGRSSTALRPSGGAATLKLAPGPDVRAGLRPQEVSPRSPFDTHINHLGEPADRLPPVKPGFTRLYRGIFPGADKLPNINDEAGRWFASDPQEARNYGTDKGTLTYVDVPNSVAEAADRARTVPPDRDGTTFPDKLEYVLPREWASKAVDVLKPTGEENGLQPKTTGEQETTGQAGVPGQTSLGSETGNAGQVGGQEPTGTTTSNEIGGTNGQATNRLTFRSTPNDLGSGLEGQPGGAVPGAVQPPTTGAGNLRSNAGNAAVAALGPNASESGRANAANAAAAATRTHDYSPTTRATRDIQAAQRGTTFAEQAAKTGTSGWASSSDVETQLRQDVLDLAQKWNIDMTKAPQFRGQIRLSDDEHGELYVFDQKPNDGSNKGKAQINRSILYIPDDPRLAPVAHMANAKDWASLTAANKLVDAIRLHEKGDPTLEYLPVRLHDDATRIALVLRAFSNPKLGHAYFDNARAFPDSLNFDDQAPGSKEVWRALQPTFADQADTFMNTRAVVAHNSRLEAGVFRNDETGERFDPAWQRALTETGIYKAYNRNGDSIENLTRASRGLMPESAKVSDMAGAQEGEARGPMDMWFMRLGFGKDNAATTKMYDYEFGRLNFITRMFSALDPTISVPQIHAAMWFGYQDLVSEQLLAIKKAAFATGDPALIKMAQGIRANLVSKDLAAVFREYHGLTEGSKPPIFALDKLVAKHRTSLVSLSDEFYSQRHLKGKLGTVTSSGKKLDRLDIQERGVKIGSGEMQYHETAPRILRSAHGLRRDLADFYKANFVDSKTVRGPLAARQSLERNVGPILMRLMETAYAQEYPAETKEFAGSIAKLLDIATPSANAIRTAFQHGRLTDDLHATMEDRFNPILKGLHDKMGLPQGLLGLRFYYAKDTAVAYFETTEPNLIHVNARSFNFLTVGRELAAANLADELAAPHIKELVGYARQKAEKYIDELSRGTDETVGEGVLGHEIGHRVAHDIYGSTIDYSEGARDEELIPAAHALLEVMTPRYMQLLVEEGMGNEIEALLHAHSSSVNEYLGGIPGASVAKGEVMRLEDAIDNLLEHQADQWAMYHKLPHSGYTPNDGPEPFRRSIYEPKTAEASTRELGKIYEKALKISRDTLAVEAESQLSGRGPNPEIDLGLLEPEESGAGVSTYARLSQADSVQSGASGWVDSKASDQGRVGNLLTSGERTLNLKATVDGLRQHMASPTYKPNPDDEATLRDLNARIEELNRPPIVRSWQSSDPRMPHADDPWLQRTTAQASARVQREEGEGQAAYALRMVKASGAYTDLDHALSIAKSARDGAWTPVLYGDKVGFRVNNRFYAGTPGDHVANWADGFHEAIHNVLDAVPDQLLANEPAPGQIGEIHPEQLTKAFADEFRPPVPNARVGAVSITGKAGEERPIPALSPHDFIYAQNANRPTLRLSANSAANRVKAHFEAVQPAIDQAEELQDQKLFDPIIEEIPRLAEAGEGNPPPLPPVGGGGNGGGGGDEPPSGGKPSKGMTPGEKEEAARKAALIKSGQVLNDYLDALKKSLEVEDPAHRTITAGINDLISQALSTFDSKLWNKDGKTWVVDAANAMRTFSKQYDRVGTDIDKRIAALELKFPGANDRISKVFYAKTPAERQDLLSGMSPEEAALADHLHNYWKLLGNTLERAGVIKSAVENYIPLMLNKETLNEKGEVISRPGKNYRAKSVHQIARQKAEEGGSLFESPDELQAWADAKGLDWQVEKRIGQIFKAQGNSVTQALTMKHTIDQLSGNTQVQIGKSSLETAPPILTQKELHQHPVAMDYSNDYVRSTAMIGRWKNALNRSRWVGDQRVTEDYYVHKSVANVMEREATLAELPDDLVTNAAKTISHVNQLWKGWQFFYTPMHEFSLLANISTHAGLNPLGVPRILREGAAIVNDPARAADYYLLSRGGGSDEPKELTGLQARIPTYKRYHDFIWKTTMYNGTYGLGYKLMQENLAAWAENHPGESITPADRFDAAKLGMDAAKKAMGSMSSLDMSKNWSLWGNVLFLANKWTTGQLRTLGEALNFGPLKGVVGPLARMGGAIPLEGHTPEWTKFMQERQMAMSQRLLTGGMIRMAIVGTVASTAISAILDNGTPSTPFDNFQKDPAHTFDIYAGRDQTTGKDMWYRMPFYLFQREMVDWVLSSVKANSEGKGWVDTNNLGDSILAAPFVKFAGKLDPITKLSLETITGTELAGWMKGFSNSQIDSDTYIKNLNKSLQTMGIGDGGSLENRFLNIIRTIMPSLSYPTNLKAPTSDKSQILAALGIGVGPLSVPTGLGSTVAPFLGSSQIQGTTYKVGPDGKVQPAWQIQNFYDKQTQLGQQILQIASTLGTGNAEEEKQKMEQMETLRQQAGFSPGTLVQLILHGDSTPTGEKGILSQNLPLKAPGTIKAPVQLAGRALTPEQEVAYNSVTFQRQAQAIYQAVADPTWKTMDQTQRSAEVTSLKQFADRITNQQFEVALGIKKGNVVTDAQSNSMLAEFGLIKRATQNGLLQSAIYSSAKPEDQVNMMADRVSASENAVWEKYYGITSVMKGASDQTLAGYVALQSGLRDEARQIVEKLPSYSRSLDPAAQIQEMKLALTFADNLVNQSIQGKTPRTFDSPLTQGQLLVAVKNGIVLQDAALKQLHSSFIYQEAPQADQLALDTKYVTLAHNVALYDLRAGIQEGAFGDNTGFNSILSTTLRADEGYQTLVEQYFGTGGRAVLLQREAELADLKARFRQEYNVAPADLSRYDALINRWYEQQNPDYAAFLYYRNQWEKYDPLGQAYRATIQSNYGFEATNPLALSSAS